VRRPVASAASAAAGQQAGCLKNATGNAVYCASALFIFVSTKAGDRDRRGAADRATDCFSEQCSGHLQMARARVRRLFARLQDSLSVN